jgi:hypothetical protein
MRGKARVHVSMKFFSMRLASDCQAPAKIPAIPAAAAGAGAEAGFACVTSERETSRE